MKFLYLVLVYFTSVSADCPNICDGVCIKSKYHSIRLLKDKLREVHDLAYNPKDKSVYIVYTNSVNSSIQHLGSINLKTKDFWKDTGFVYWPTAIAISNESDILYAGGADGLYKLYLKPKVTNLMKVKSVEDGIRSIYLTTYGRLYYITQCGDVYLYAYDEVTDNLLLENFKQHVNIDKFVMDKYNAMVFIDKSAVFCVPHNNAGPAPKELVRIDINDANDIAVDPNKDVFIATKRGVFAFDSKSNNLTKYGTNMENIKKIIFYGVDKPIFVVNDNLYIRD